jgi:hypothetical protein
MVFKKESFGLDAPGPKLWDVSELQFDSDEDDGEPDPLSPEDWQDWYSEDLLEAWTSLTDYTTEKYIAIKATYPKFVDFVMYPPNVRSLQPTKTESDIWKLVSRTELVRERVTDAQFFTWIRENIDASYNV